MEQQPLLGQDLFIGEASRSHSDTPNSVGLLLASDQPDAETSTWQHTTFTTERHPFRTRNPNKRAAADPRFRSRSNLDQRSQILKYNAENHLTLLLAFLYLVHRRWTFSVRVRSISCLLIYHTFSIACESMFVLYNYTAALGHCLWAG